MCWRSASEYDLYGARVLDRVVLCSRGCATWRPRQPKMEEAEVVPFLAEAVAPAKQEADRRGSKAA
jgi:hypothetical protein